MPPCPAVRRSIGPTTMLRRPLAVTGPRPYRQGVGEHPKGFRESG